MILMVAINRVQILSFNIFSKSFIPLPILADLRYKADLSLANLT
jgi:hypothetical protein